jgi:glycosyltransferase involved in cell wall biosynthesis
MKILIATGIYPPSIGGPATYSKLIFDELPKHGIEAEVLSFDEVRHLPKIIRHFAYFFKTLSRGKKADIIFAQDPVSVGLPAMWAAKILGKKCILKIVGDYAWEQGAQRSGITEDLDSFSKKNGDTAKGYPRLVRRLKRTQIKVATAAKKIIVPSRYLKSIITNWGIDPEKIQVIYNAFEGAHVETSRQVIRAKLGIEGPLFSSAGRLVPWKGFEALVDATMELAKNIPGVKSLIIGEGPYRSALEKKIATAKASDHVMLAGKMKQTELWKYIKASDAFVLNTQYEGFSHQLLEVMALGTPIVTTRTGGNIELIDHGKSGLLVEYNDTKGIVTALLTILKMEGEGERLTSGAKQKVSAFTKERMIAELITTLSHIEPTMAK